VKLSIILSLSSEGTKLGNMIVLAFIFFFPDMSNIKKFSVAFGVAYSKLSRNCGKS
jgi:hypothetical protein